MSSPPKKRPHWIPVVAALIRRNNSLLLGLRPEGHNLAGLWEFPGGKIEIGESPEAALQRELREELGIEAEVGGLKLATTHSFGNTGIVLLFFEVNFWKGEPKTCHHSELKWVLIEELKNYQLPEANQKILSHILSVLK